MKRVTTPPAQLHGRSSLDLTGKDPKDSVKLISAEGPLRESMACFRMLAQIMGLPFRRDSLEKTIRERSDAEKNRACR